MENQMGQARPVRKEMLFTSHILYLYWGLSARVRWQFFPCLFVKFRSELCMPGRSREMNKGLNQRVGYKGCKNHPDLKQDMVNIPGMQSPDVNFIQSSIEIWYQNCQRIPCAWKLKLTGSNTRCAPLQLAASTMCWHVDIWAIYIIRVLVGWTPSLRTRQPGGEPVQTPPWGRCCSRQSHRERRRWKSRASRSPSCSAACPRWTSWSRRGHTHAPSRTVPQCILRPLQWKQNSKDAMVSV